MKHVDKLVYALWAACAVALAAEFFYHKHPYFGFDGWFGFYAAFGFLAYCFIVFSAKGLRRLIRRDEDYYGEGDSEAEERGGGDD
jgi:hypothetical protein